jgi:hypothetical protein
MRMVSHSGREAITGKQIRAERLRMQTALQLLVFSGVISTGQRGASFAWS